MIKHNLLFTTGVSALLAGFMAAPAVAQDADGNGVASEAQGDFEGFTASPTMVARSIEEIEVTFDAPTFTRTSRGFEGYPVPPEAELIVRDDIGTTGAIDFGNTLPAVVQIFRQDNVTGGIFFNCTGTIINPRTVLTAAHCLNSRSSEAYGLPGAADNTMLIATGVSSADRLFNYIGTGNGYAAGGVASSTDVVIHPSANLDNGGLPFPWADVAFIALDAPITDVPAMPLLLTPLDQLTHVIVTGYGTTGTGDNGAQGIGFFRRIGENMLGAVASNTDLIDTIFPGFAPSALTLGFETQALYFIDFDDPERAAPGEDSCTFSGFGISCPDLETVKAIDWFDGDALPMEAGTAPGDSGSPLIADQLTSFPLITGVLSGGWDFFGTNNRYGDISFYNPLYPFFEFITENTPYKYVSALPGDGEWSDPSHWTQDLDPGFYIQNEDGEFVNGIPEGSEPGVYEGGPKLGSILGQDISGYSDAPSPFLPPEGTPGFGGNLPESSALLGPGSTGFVPNNTDGTPGTAFANPAQYFDVLLTAPGTTSVDIDVEIDRLTIDGSGTRLILTPNKTLTSLIGVEQYKGRTTINGQLNAGNVLLFGGMMDGSGTVSTGAFFNIAGGLFPGGDNVIGNFTIDGGYIQTSGGTLVIDISSSRRNPSDLLAITGDASLAGLLVLNPNGKSSPGFGSQFQVLTANSVLGDFDTVFYNIDSPVLYAESIVGAGDVTVEIKAHSIATLMGDQSALASVGATLDALRFSGRYAEFSNLFSVVDGAGYAQFGATLLGLTPTSGFAQTETANNFARRFTGQIAQRTLTLRAGSEAAAGFSSYGTASFAQAGEAPAEVGKLGFFGSISGSFLDAATDRGTGARALEERAFSEAGEMTIGADLKLSDAVTVGVAVSNVRDSASGGFSGTQPHGNESLATAAYATVGFGKGFADLYLGFADQRFGLERGGQGLLEEQFRTAAGLADGEQTLAGARIGYALTPADGVMVGPVASLDYVRSDLEGYRELHAGAFGLNVADRTFTSIGAKLGLMGAVDMKLGERGKVTAFGSVAYARELGDQVDVVTASFVGAESLPFDITRQLAQDWVAVNGGAEVQLSNTLSTKLSVSTDMGRGALTNHQGQATLSWRF